MLERSRCLLLLLLFIDATRTQKLPEEHLGNNHCKKQTDKPNQLSHNLDLLAADVEKQQWTTNEDIICLQKLQNILNGVKNSTLWAMWIWDSMQTPTGIFYGSRYQLGNFDQCMKAPWLETHKEYRTKYCLADIRLSDIRIEGVNVDPHGPAQSYIESSSELGLTFNTIVWGVCVPVECDSKATTKFVRALFKQTHLGVAMSPLEVKIDDPCQVAGASEEYSDKYYIFLLISSFSLTMTVICTIINGIWKSNHNSTSNRIVKAFCIQENVGDLSKEVDGDICAIHALRLLISSVVVLLHVWIINYWIGNINLLDMEKDTNKYNLKSFYHADLTIDTYFMMSGLLLAKGLMSYKQFNPLWVIFKRYLRFIRLLGFILLFAMPVIVQIADGPIWYRITMDERNSCLKTGWATVVMMGNYVDTGNICYPILWSLPCDLHLSAVGVILIWIYHKNRHLGLASFTVLVIAAMVMPGLVTYQQNLPAVPNFNMKAMTNMTYFRNTLLTDPLYLWSHLRAGPYLVGLAMGYIMYIYKPAEHRKIFNEFWSSIGFWLAFSSAILLMMASRIFHDKSRTYDVWEAAIFVSLNRTIWAILTGCLIIFCEYGTVPLIDSIIRWPMILPLSKLSYGTNLIHSLVFICIAASTRTPLRHSMLLVMFFHTFAVITISVVISFLLHVFYEAPLTKLFLIFRRKTTKTTQNEISTSRSTWKEN